MIKYSYIQFSIDIITFCGYKYRMRICVWSQNGQYEIPLRTVKRKQKVIHINNVKARSYNKRKKKKLINSICFIWGIVWIRQAYRYKGCDRGGKTVLCCVVGSNIQFNTQYQRDEYVTTTSKTFIKILIKQNIHTHRELQHTT